jgi:hypothetical protein
MALRRDHGGARALGVQEFLNELVVGRVVLVHYSDEPELWHERLCLWPAGGEENDGIWAIRIPDADIYCEDLSGKTPDDGPNKVALMDRDRVKPRFLVGQLYRFGVAWSEAELRGFIVEGRAALRADQLPYGDPGRRSMLHGGQNVATRMLYPNAYRVANAVMRRPAGAGPGAVEAEAMDEERGAGGARDRPGADAEPRARRPCLRGAQGQRVSWAAEAAEREEPGQAQGSQAQGAQLTEDELHPGDGYLWVSLEIVGGLVKGQEIDLVVGDARLGDRGLHTLDSGDIVAVTRVSVAQAIAGVEVPDGDARVLGALTYDHERRRHIDFGDAVRKMKQEPVTDFPLRGERSCGWLLRYIADHGGTPDGRHTKWAVEQKIDRDSSAYNIHDMLGLAMEVAATWDQIDLQNLACMEVVARIYQLIEETQGSMRIEGLEHFVGRDVAGSLKRGVALAPGLAKHTTDQLAAQTSILKEKRKAREEAAQAKGKPAAK